MSPSAAKRKVEEIRKAVDFFRPQAFQGKRGLLSAMISVGSAASLAMLVAVSISALGVLVGALAAIFLILKLVLGADVSLDPGLFA